MQIVYLMGVNGAGKTTAAKKLAENLSIGQKCEHIHCGDKSLLLRLVRYISRLVFRNNDSRRHNGPSEKRRTSVTYRMVGYRRLYMLLWSLDFVLICWLKLLRHWLTGSIVIMERYYLDHVINIGTLLGNSTNQMLKHKRTLEFLLPKPSLILYFDVPDDVAFGRKKDIPSVDYLRERREKQEEFLKEYRVVKIDARNPAPEVHSEALGIVLKHLIQLPAPARQCNSLF